MNEKKTAIASEKQVLRICFRFRLENATQLDASGLWMCFSLSLSPIFARRYAFSHIYADTIVLSFSHLFSLCIILLRTKFWGQLKRKLKEKREALKMTIFFSHSISRHSARKINEEKEQIPLCARTKCGANVMFPSFVDCFSIILILK